MSFNISTPGGTVGMRKPFEIARSALVNYMYAYVKPPYIKFANVRCFSHSTKFFIKKVAFPEEKDWERGESVEEEDVCPHTGSWSKCNAVQIANGTAYNIHFERRTIYT